MFDYKGSDITGIDATDSVNLIFPIKRKGVFFVVKHTTGRRQKNAGTLIATHETISRNENKPLLTGDCYLILTHTLIKSL